MNTENKVRQLPPLPPACGIETLTAIGWGYTEDDMKAYAISALEQQRPIEAQGVPDETKKLKPYEISRMFKDKYRDGYAVQHSDAQRLDWYSKGVRDTEARLMASAPPAPQPLSDEQIELMMRSIGTTYADDNDDRMKNHAGWQRMKHRQIVRAIEAAHGIKGGQQ